MSAKPEPLPCHGVSFKVAVTQDVATVILRQNFENFSDSSIEIDYTFPIPPDAALAGLTVHAEGRVIQGVVKLKEQAHQEYSDALASGALPYMAELHDRKVTLHIGALSPQVEVAVEVVYVIECSFAEGIWRLVLPRSLVPKHSGHKSTEGQLQDWELECRVETSSDLQDVQMNLPYEADQQSKKAVVLRSSAKSFPYEDVEISYSTDDPSAPYSILQRDPRTGALGLHFTFQPPVAEADLEDFDPSGEFILLLDRSGSMNGRAIDKAKEATELFVKSLPERSLFNIISFGGSHTPIFPSSVPYTEGNVKEALDELRSFKADLGGTEILRPLQGILKSEPHSSFPRYVFLITDGEVSNVKQIVEMVADNHRNTRVSCIGIGHGASRSLIQDVARAGQGSSRIINLKEDITQGVLLSLAAAIRPTLNDIQVKWLSGVPAVQCPPKPFYAFSGDRVCFNAVVEEGAETIAFQVSYLDCLSQVVRTVECVKRVSEASEGCQAVVQAVRGAFDTAQEAELSVKYQVLSKSTSLIAVDHSLTAVSQPTHLVSVAVKTRARLKSKSSRGRGRPKAQMLCEGYDSDSSSGSKASVSKCNRKGLVQASDEAVGRAKRLRSRSRSPIRVSSAYQSMTLILLQQPSGCWVDSPALEAILTKMGFAMKAAMQKHPGQAAAVVITALVVAVLLDKFPEETHVWGLVVQKARRWLKKHGASDLPSLLSTGELSS
jgi:hypothetical protein